jgi:hypothetical protein
MMRMILKDINGDTLVHKPYYDARATATTIKDSVNQGYIHVEDEAVRICWSCRGYIYQAVRGKKGLFVFDGLPAKIIGG